MFSVIIPLYNKAPYIEKALRSVLDQTFREFEIIIVNDESTDNGIEIVNHLFTLLTPPLGGWGAVTQKNVGVSTARNNGVKLAKFPYICFLDADDWWAPTFLEEMKGLIDEFPDAGIYGTSYFKVKDGTSIPAGIGIDENFERGEINYCQVYAKTMWMPLTSISVCIPKSVFDDEKGFKPNLKLGEDFDLWIRIALKYPVVLLNKPLAYYNQDVEIANRAIGNLHNPESHILWNLDYLEETEKSNSDLKQLLDNLRVYSLSPYQLDRRYRMQAQTQLGKVNWEQQPIAVRIRYHLPFIIKKFEQKIKIAGSKMKRYFIKLFRSV